MKYKTTHTWLQFSLNVDVKDYRLWLQLGEITSKCEHLSGIPLRPAFAKHLNQVFLAKGVLATTAIEGNTLSEEQVQRHLEGKLQLPPSQEYLKQEIDNIVLICNAEIQNQMHNTETKVELCRHLIESYNERVLHKLELDEDVVPGQLRKHSVVVGNVYRGAPAEDCDHLLERLCEWLNGKDFMPPDTELAVPFALIKAIVAHVYLAWIHPFGDGNGRTARLVEFHILFSSGLPLPAAHLLSDHYNKTRTRYYRELDRTSKTGGNLMPFIKYAVQGFLDGLREQIAGVKEHQMTVAWENYVHDTFREKKTSPTQKRRRDLVLELSHHDWVSVSEIEELSPRVAKLYATAGDRMLQRDLNSLAKANLLERIHGKVKARKSLIQAFLPARVPEIDQDSNPTEA